MSKHMQSNHLKEVSTHSRLLIKAADIRYSKSSEVFNNAMVKNNPNNLANLESRFGNNSTIFNDNQNNPNLNEDLSSSSSSEIDCEEIGT